MTSMLVFSIFPFLLIYAAISDFRTMRIPNWLTGLMFLSFFPVAFIAGMPWDIMGWHLAAFGVVLAVCFGLFAFGLIGGGDAKMLAAAALWIGWWPLMGTYIVYTTLFGGLLAIIMKVWQALQLEHGIWGTEGVLRKILNKKLDLPYGAAIAAGALVTIPETWWRTFLMS